ncbi:MAG: sigma-70 family RNA polymerase sigma factor, partial [Vulcanisaeta sp.]
MKELKALKELISKLIDKVEELERRSNINCQNNIQTRDEQPDNEFQVPDFIRDNPWVDVLRLKRDS